MFKNRTKNKNTNNSNNNIITLTLTLKRNGNDIGFLYWKRDATFFYKIDNVVAALTVSLEFAFVFSKKFNYYLQMTIAMNMTMIHTSQVSTGSIVSNTALELKFQDNDTLYYVDFRVGGSRIVNLTESHRQQKYW